MKRLFANNRRTTIVSATLTNSVDISLAAPLNDVTFGDTVTSEGVIDTNLHYLATLYNDSVPALAGITEIVAVIKNVGTNIRVVRAREGTTAQAWPAGSSIEVRLTAGTLTNIPLSLGGGSKLRINLGSVHNRWNSNNPLEVLTREAVPWLPNTSYLISPTVVFFPTGEFYGYLFSVGTSGATEPTLGTAVAGDVILDEQCKWLVLAVAQIEGDPPLIEGLYIEEDSAGVINGVSLGRGNLCLEGTVVGAGSRSLKLGGLALGDSVFADHENSTVIGVGASSAYNNGLFTSQAGAANLSDNLFGDANTTANMVDGPWMELPTNGVSVLWSGPIDLAGGPTWFQNTGVKRGQVVRPTSANGYQYVRDVRMKFPATPWSRTGFVEPTWPTVQGDRVDDGDGTDPFGAVGSWVAYPNVGRQIGYFEQPFVLEELGIVCLERANVSTNPSISIGQVGSNTLVLGATAVTTLTATNRVHRILFTTNCYQLTEPTFSITTLATGTAAATMLCRVYLKGFFVKHWL